MNKEFRVALVQRKAEGMNPTENMKLAVTYIKEAKEMGAHIVLFPEMWSNGYTPPFESALDDPFDTRYEKEREEWINQAIDERDQSIQMIQAVAKEQEIGVVITYLGKGVERPTNTALVISNTGEILMKYSKVHTCDFSLEALLESGDRFEVCDFQGVKLGVMICYDREFPESARLLMLEGAEIILVPNACDMNPARLNQLSTRAYENMVGVAMGNYPGKWWGQSCAYSPIVFNNEGYVDNELMMFGDTEECIKVVSFDMEKIREYRAYEAWGNAYRKVGTYEKLLDTKVEAPFIREPLQR